MAVTIGSNIASLTLQRKLAEGTSALTKTYERLSSGLRINRAADDAVGLAVADSLNAQARIALQAQRNLNDGISLCNIAQGALNELKNITFRQAELAEQSANGAYSIAQRRALAQEADKLTEEFNRIIATTTFNGIQLLQYSPQSIRIQAGSGINGGIEFSPSAELTRTVGSGQFTQLWTHNWGAGVFSPDCVAVGDMDHDGVEDLVAGFSNQYRVSIYLLNPDNSIKSVSSSYGGSGVTGDVSLADLNNDGNLDVISRGWDSGTISVGFGAANGSISSWSSISAGPGTYTDQIVTDDFNGDGKLDVVASMWNGNLNFIAGTGNGNFATATVISTLHEGDITKGDVNGDGRQDLIALDLVNDTMQVFLNSGSGFTATSTVGLGFDWYPAIHIGQSVAAGDLNNDGYEDVAFVNVNTTTLSIFLSKGDGTFQAQRTVQCSNTGRAIAIGDVNGDGLNDLVTAQGDYNVFINQGQGNFVRTTVSSATNIANNLTLFDFNHDGALDFAGDHDTNGTVSIYTAVTTANTTSAPYLNLRTVDGARAAINTVKDQLDRLNEAGGMLGAAQIRFETALHMVAANRDTLLQARSRIMDVDFAEESAQLIRMEILQKVSTSLLAQANQSPQIALSLLRQ